jgi:hypothetical protein
MEQPLPLIVRFFKRTNTRLFQRSVVVEEAGAPDSRKLRVTYGSKSRDTGRRMKMFGNTRIFEYAGPNRNTLAIRLGGESLHELPTNRDAINEYVRRVRPDDADELARHDAAIEDAREALRAARDNRLHFLHEAFQRAHSVTVKELVALAEQAAARQ